MRRADVALSMFKASTTEREPLPVTLIIIIPFLFDQLTPPLRSIFVKPPLVMGNIAAARIHQIYQLYLSYWLRSN